MTGIGLIVAIAIPVVVYFGGARIMKLVSGSKYCSQLRGNLPAEDRVPLNRRYRGYDLAAVHRHWEPLARDEYAIMCENRLLRMDLLFPFFYCGAFGVSFLILASMVDRSVSLILGFAFVVMAATLLSDLTENLVQLAQFRGYIETGEPSLNEKWIWVASTATKMKLVFFAAALLLVLVMCLAVLLGL
jgi:hypothetical protein